LNVAMPSFQALKGQVGFVVLLDLHVGWLDCAGGALAVWEWDGRIKVAGVESVKDGVHNITHSKNSKSKSPQSRP